MMRSPRIRHVKVTNNKLRESIDRSRKNEDSWVLWESRNTEIKYCPFCGADCEIVEGSLGFQVVCMGEKKHSLNRFSKTEEEAVREWNSRFKRDKLSEYVHTVYEVDKANNRVIAYNYEGDILHFMLDEFKEEDRKKLKKNVDIVESYYREIDSTGDTKRVCVVEVK